MQESMITDKIYPAYTRPEKNIPRGAHGMSTSLKCQMLHPKNAKKKMFGKNFRNILKILAEEISDTRIYIIVWSKVSFIYI